MVNFAPLAAEIDSVVWGITANFNRFRILAALLHSSQVEGTTYIQQGAITLGIGPHF